MIPLIHSSIDWSCVSSRRVEWRDDEAVVGRLWSHAKTFAPVLDILERVARSGTRGVPSIRHLRTLGHEIHSAIREVHYATLVRDLRIKQVPASDDQPARRVVAGWRRTRLGPAGQLHRLSRAVARMTKLDQSRFKFEQAWRGLTPVARSILQHALEDMRSRGGLAGYVAVDPVEPAVLTGDLPPVELLCIVLPRAIQLARHHRGHPELSAKDQAVATLIDIFMGLTGRHTDGLARGDAQGPAGPCARFIRDVEKVFDIRLLSEGSVHGVRRARKILKARGATK